jgi:hypothetical protein
MIKMRHERRLIVAENNPFLIEATLTSDYLTLNAKGIL